MLRFSFVAAVFAGISTTSIAAALPNGWEVHEADQFCYAWQATPDSSGTELGLALDTNEKATIILSNRAWQLKPKRSYRVTVGVPGSLKAIKAQSLDIGSGKLALAAGVSDAGFVRQFASSSALQFELQKAESGPSSGSFNLDGASAAVVSLQACQAQLKEKVRAIAKNMMDRDSSFRTDPHGDDWVEPSPNH
jgi:hypothetical protein